MQRTPQHWLIISRSLPWAPTRVTSTKSVTRNHYVSAPQPLWVTCSLHCSLDHSINSFSMSQQKKLNLKEGMNEIEFSVTTAYQGTTRCKCYLFRWKHNDKVVISDIDGTITKSDVLGHILPMVGKDWAQLGVAELFSKIEQNGYKLLYLSARAIGQSRVTREYLRSIRQGNVMLPDGPLLLNPTSLISAFHREVIEKKPEQFKIACLSDIRDLFPDKEPFYAGYGNRINVSSIVFNPKEFVLNPATLYRMCGRIEPSAYPLCVFLPSIQRASWNTNWPKHSSHRK